VQELSQLRTKVEVPRNSLRNTGGMRFQRGVGKQESVQGETGLTDQEQVKKRPCRKLGEILRNSD